MSVPPTKGPLRTLKILEFAGLAPVPLAGMILADFGASVLRIDKVGIPMSMNMDKLSRGKRSIAINLKSAEGVKLVEKLASASDVLIEPFRPGIMEKIGLGPERLLSLNQRLIYARLTGYGQTSGYANKAGHDINYVALSGVLSMLGRKGENPFPPINLLGDFAGGSLLCILGILSAVIERSLTGRGQVVDSSIADGTAYLSSFLHRTSKIDFLWGGERGSNILDSGAFFYDTYKTKDGKYMSVGALETKFYKEFVEGIGMPELLDLQYDRERWPEYKKKVTEIFLTKSRDDWCKVFCNGDACVEPVLDMNEAPGFHAALGRETFVKNTIDGDDIWEPLPTPILSEHNLKERRSYPEVGEHTVEVLKELGFNKSEIDNYLEQGIIEQYSVTSSL